ncbi:hypothetical protein [Nonomuraea indica]|uniref:hypothetical protein n=1 Tax=Nonomuraea indica TaxID=1581193 RepID=UPI000C7B4B08|nr:hypothetical protein [Nonomuraea indica]
MSRLGPIVTLAAGAVLAAGLGVASVTAAPAADPTAAARPDDTNTTGDAVRTGGPDGTGDGAEATAPAAEPSPTPRSGESASAGTKLDYAGRVPGNGGLIAISVRGGKAIGYFCDGRTEAWLKGDATGGKVGLEGFGGATAGATLGGGKATGWLRLGGRKWNFTAATVKKPSGLYRATAQIRSARLRAGWIVLRRPEGGFTQVGAAVLDETQVRVPQLDGDRPTAPVSVDGATLYPQDVDGFIQEMR